MQGEGGAPRGRGNTLAQYLNTWLAVHRTTAKWLAERAGVPHSVLSFIRRGGIPRPATLRALARAMGVPPSELFLRAGYLTPVDLAGGSLHLPPDEQDLLKDYRLLAPVHRRLVRLFLRHLVLQRLSAREEGEAEVVDTLNRYLEALQEGEPGRLRPFYHLPCVVAGSEVHGVASPADLEEALARLVMALGPSPRTGLALEDRAVRVLGEGSALASGVLMQSPGQRMGVTWALLRTGSEWRIAFQSLHPPDRLPPLDL